MDTRLGKCTEKHLEYLDDLRESGVTNMYGAVEYLEGEFPNLSYGEAKAITAHWMRTFSKRHPKDIA